MQDRQPEVGIYNLEYSLLLMPIGRSVNPETIPQNTIALKLTESGRVGAYLPKHHHHNRTSIKYIELAAEELSQLKFPDYSDSPILITENDNKELVNKITSICGCRCNFLDFYDINEKKLDLSKKNLTIEAILTLFNFLQTHPEIEILDISSNNIGSEGKELLARNTTLKKIIMFDTNFNDKDAEFFSENITLITLNIVKNSITLKGLIILADSMIAQIYPANNNFSHRHTDVVLNEANPLERANYGRRNGLATIVPSLTKVCLFAMKKHAKEQNMGADVEIEISEMPPVLTKKINQKRI